MPRTDATQVGAVIELDEDIGLDPFITAANALVTEVCAPATKLVNGVTVLCYDDARLAMIETWLAAHFYAQRDPRMASVSAGVSVSYQSAVTFGFKNTHYGQMAMRLDTAGKLAALDKRMERGGGVGRGYWLGSPLNLIDDVEHP